MFGGYFAFQIVQNGGGGGQCKGEFFLGCRSGFLQVIGTHVHRVPFGQVFTGVGGDVRDHTKRWFWRADVSAARQVFLDNVVLHGALQRADVGTLFFGHGDIKRQQPRGGRVDRHRRVHLIERNIVKQGAHIAQVVNRHTNFADLAFRQDMIAVIARLRWQIEGNRESGLALGKVAAIQRIRCFRGRVTCICPKQPRAIFLRLRHTGYS